MFLDDLNRSILAGGGLHSVAQDARLFGRDWGFRLSDIKVPVHWWHGDSDTIVPLRHGEHVVSRLPNASLTVRPGDSHLSGYAAADDVIATMRALFD
jgi:pimeloyl-ACP methyl ester carboxylesterase